MSGHAAVQRHTGVAKQPRVTRPRVDASSVCAAVIVLAACTLRGASSDNGHERQALERGTSGNVVTVTDVTHLSFAALPRAPNAFARVFRLPDGGWGVSAEPFVGVVQRFDSNGVAAGTLGRSGQGPGEFRGMVFGVTVGDTLWVVNHGNGRLSMYSKDLVFLRSRPLAYRVFSVSPARQGAGLLLSGFFHPVAGTAPWSSVARVSTDERMDVFGGSVPDTPEIPNLERQFAAATPAGEVWTVATMGGAIDVLRLDDLSVVERFRLSGVPSADEILPPVRRSDGPPSPEVAGITADEHGLLWVLIGVADADWTPQMRSSVDGINNMVDIRVLAIDPDTRTVVGETLLDDVCFPAGGALISCVYEADQVIRIRKLGLVHE